MAGVVATGVVVVRAERRRRAYTPDQVREQLHARFAQATTVPEVVGTAAAEPRGVTGIGRRIRKWFRRRSPQDD
ncbi:hypothetical protein [Nocardia arthritidis]|uniref:hypothetical protein n=1 Tax=Nocardia arthritidis TaxID=228602 RepID=UPI000A689366